ncbi:hypothetical protein [Saccharothrix sp. Mg75]|uniref:hypothetical protein n=1 Tax=Saccharothrix sp. Mg75 TaxID=3445357 RepID=UPI003EEF32C6
MLKKASTVAAVVAGLMMLGSPAFALSGEPDEHGFHPVDGGNFAIGEADLAYLEGENGDVSDQFGAINFGNDSDLLSQLNVCNTEVNVIAVPVLSHNDHPNLCVNTDDDDNDTVVAGE